MQYRSLLSKTGSHMALIAAVGALSFNASTAYAFDYELDHKHQQSYLSNTIIYQSEAAAGVGASTGVAATAASGASVALPLAAVAAAAAVAIAGGSNSSATSTETFVDTTVGDYGTEYNAQSGLAQIDAASLNNYGYTGQGVKVAVVDTGINAAHAEFSGKTINGTNYSSSEQYNEDSGGHGTHVASIIAGTRNASGMRGVAYDAELYSYNYISAGAVRVITDTSLASLFTQHVTDGIKVSNNSWGLGINNPISDYTESTLRASYAETIIAAKNAMANGTLFIVSAGNSAGSEVNLFAGLPARITELQSTWLAVGAVDPNNIETAYTNRCGIAKDFCVVAPGGGVAQDTDGIYAADSKTGGYVRYSGTSMAAPHVSGLAALLMQKFPSLTNAEIATRIKTTSSLANLTGLNGETLAEDGEAAMKEIFGYGLVNGEAASAAISSLSLITGDNYYTSASHDVSAAKMQLPAGISASVRDAILADEFVVFDTFDGARFAVSGAEVFDANLNTADASTLSYAQSSGAATGDANKVAFTSQTMNAAGGLLVSLTEGNTSAALTSSQYWGDKSGMIARPSFISASDNVSQIDMRMNYSDTLSLGTFIQTVNTGGNVESGIGFTADWAATPNTVLHTSVSHIPSQIGLSITDDESYALISTNMLSLGFKHKFSNSVELFGNMSQYAIKDVAPTAASFGLSDAQFNSKTLGVEYTGIQGVKASLGIYDNGTMHNGAVSYLSALGRDADGTIYYDTRSYSSGSGYLNRDNIGIFFASTMDIHSTKTSDTVLSVNYQSMPGQSLHKGNFGVLLSHTY